MIFIESTRKIIMKLRKIKFKCSKSVFWLLGIYYADYFYPHIIPKLSSIDEILKYAALNTNTEKSNYFWETLKTFSHCICILIVNFFNVGKRIINNTAHSVHIYTWMGSRSICPFISSNFALLAIAIRYISITIFSNVWSTVS